MSNTRIWDALGKTDPKHTKKFQRSGGFKGTAIKPIWLALRMTEHFGPCGIGWGPEKPEFQVVPTDTEILVFCTVSLWYREAPESTTTGRVYGVGGDKVLISQTSGLRASDEAFKAAYTDALGNAMKLIGVAADVHMGFFDDSKYVKEVAAEFDAADESQERPADPEAKKTTLTQVVMRVVSKAQAEEIRKGIIESGKNRPGLDALLASLKVKATGNIPADRFKECMEWIRGEAEMPTVEAVAA